MFSSLSVTLNKLLHALITDNPPDDAASGGIEVDADLTKYHIHLPKLADCGLITWDRGARRVTKGPNFDAAAEILLCLRDSSDVLSVEVDAE